MPKVVEKFDQDKVDGLKRYLQREATKNRKKDFEIIIDGFKVISRTDNVDEFDDYEQEIRDDSLSISFLIYDGPLTNRNTRYTFSLREDAAIPEKPVNGLGSLGEIEQVVNQRLSEREKELELERLKQELENVKKDLADAEEYNEMLEQDITDLKAKRFKDNGSLGEILNAFVGAVVKNNASKLPGGELLAGLFTTDNNQAVEIPQQAESSKVTFKKQEDTNEVDEMTSNRLALIADIQQKLNEQQMIGMFTIIDHLTTKPEDITTVIGLLNK